MKTPRVYIDFNDVLAPDEFALICRGTVEDIVRQNLVLLEGIRLEVSDGELIAAGVVGRTKSGEGWPGGGQWMIKIDEWLTSDPDTP